MPRQQTNSRSSVPAVRPQIPPPKIWYSAPNQPSLFDSVKQGVGFGAGSAIGHRLIGGLFGSSNPTQPTIQQPTLPTTQPYYASESYMSCIQNNKENPEVCRPFLSKEKSPWILCMESNFYKPEFCSSEVSSRS